MQNQNPLQPSQQLFINFMAEVNDKTTSLLLYVISDHLKLGIKKLHINISSGGGSVFHAISLYNFIKGIQGVEIHTHNFGQVDSSANVIFLAGQHRTCSPASSFVLHGVKTIFQGGGALDEKEFKEKQESLSMDINKIAQIIASATSKELRKVREDINKSLVLNAEDAKEYGLVHDIKDFTIPRNYPVIVITNQR